MDKEDTLVADYRYSFEDAVCESADVEVTHGCLDVGPTDALEPAALKQAYDMFFGTSPLSSPSPLPSPSRSASPIPSATSPALPQKMPHESPELMNSNQMNSKQRRNRRKSHSNRRHARAEVRLKRDDSTSVLPTGAKHIRDADTTRTFYDIGNIPAASTGFVGLRDADRPARVDELQELLMTHEFELVEWAGRKGRAIVDKNGLIIAVLVGCPEDEDWDSVHRSGHSALLTSRKKCTFPKKASNHCRGRFPALATGISYGGGQKTPGNLQNGRKNTRELDGLLAHPSFQRFAGFASSAFRNWAPRLHNHYQNNLDDLLHKQPGLRRNFSNSIWAASTFNFGPRTCTVPHRDYANLPYGWCAITAMGDFNPIKGGHLVLWDLRLVVEFPAGSTVLLPSAAITHSNTPIGHRETRTSFTQYTAGGLFRWAAHGFQPDAEYYRGMPAADLQRSLTENFARCKLGLSMFSTLEERRLAASSQVR